jgi:hypothetical protein
MPPDSGKPTLDTKRRPIPTRVHAVLLAGIGGRAALGGAGCGGGAGRFGGAGCGGGVGGLCGQLACLHLRTGIKQENHYSSKQQSTDGTQCRRESSQGQPR